MAVQIVCPSLKCRKILSVPNEVRGKIVKCQYCQTMLRVPEVKRPEPAGGKAGK
jgi:LSD1 subclass zinc finger protein